MNDNAIREDDPLIGEVVSFVRNELGTRRTIDLDSRIEKDLGCTGDDATELMVNFAKKFRVDLSSYDERLHFASEGWWPSIPKIERQVKIVDLVASAKEKRWVYVAGYD